MWHQNGRGRKCTSGKFETKIRDGKCETEKCKNSQLSKEGQTEATCGTADRPKDLSNPGPFSRCNLQLKKSSRLNANTNDSIPCM